MGEGGLSYGAAAADELLRAFVHYKHLDYYDTTLFNRTYEWMKERGITEGESGHDTLVVIYVRGAT